MNALKDIIQHCHQWREKPLRQQKTIVTPSIYKGRLYHFTVYCAHGYPVRLYDLEQAGISFMPTGRTSVYDRIPQSFEGERFLRPQRTEDWKIFQWHASWGIQVYTGISSQREGAQWHDFDFKYEMISAAPEAVLACLETLISVVKNPLLTLTQSGGLRFSCRVPHYLHPNTQEARFYIYKDAPAVGNLYQRDVYLEILGEAGHSPWDARYKILMGDLLNPPVIAKEILFTSINALREELHAPEPLGTEKTESIENFMVSTPSLGSHKLDLAKEALLKRGFSYLRKANDFHHWTQNAGEDRNTDVLLWERDGIVWICATTSTVALPTQNTPITDVWEDTGILPPIPATGLPVSEKMLAVRQGKLSPLTIKRPSPVLQKLEGTEKIYEPLNENITQIQKTFWDPQELAVSDKILEPIDDTQHLCIVSTKMDKLFLECSISRDKLEEWRVNWQASALGNFAQALLNALEVEREPVTKRIRTVMQTFQQYEEKLVRQMCQVNVQGTVVAQGITDEETGEELAHFTIAFEGGVSAYIPLNPNAAEKLIAKRLPVFRLESFVLDEAIRIPLSIEEALRLGILDMETVEKMQDFPSVSRNPDWTLWHQLKRFFAHYTRDADAPMIWHNNVLEFWVPPVLHPGVKRLLLMSATLSERDVGRAFPDEEIEVICVNPTPWVAGNQVFQIRTGVHTRRTLLDYDRTWDVIGLSKMGEQFLLGICAEIERDPSVKHAIITHTPLTKQLKDIAKRENVCLLTMFKRLSNLDAAFETAEVVWIVGTPFWQPGVIWRQAQILFGNDEEPLSYDAETEFQHYKDKRIQSIYIQMIADLLTEIIDRVGLNRWPNKKVVLISSLEIPNITDRPETLLFDWEDFEVAGGINKLAETIAIREQFETERANLTAASPRTEVERVLGCSSRQANRVLNKLRGGNIPRVTFREQILSLLAKGEKKRAEIIAAIDGHPQAIHKELMRLTKNGEIQKVRWGVYARKKE